MPSRVRTPLQKQTHMAERSKALDSNPNCSINVSSNLTVCTIFLQSDYTNQHSTHMTSSNLCILASIASSASLYKPHTKFHAHRQSCSMWCGGVRRHVRSHFKKYGSIGCEATSQAVTVLDLAPSKVRLFALIFTCRQKQLVWVGVERRVCKL